MSAVSFLKNYMDGDTLKLFSDGNQSSFLMMFLILLPRQRLNISPQISQRRLKRGVLLVLLVLLVVEPDGIRSVKIKNNS